MSEPGERMKVTVLSVLRRPRGSVCSVKPFGACWLAVPHWRWPDHESTH